MPSGYSEKSSEFILGHVDLDQLEKLENVAEKKIPNVVKQAGMRQISFAVKTKTASCVELRWRSLQASGVKASVFVCWCYAKAQTVAAKAEILAFGIVPCVSTCSFFYVLQGRC